ncbi:hypothetical protein ACMCNP_07275 [Candidatus Acidulodesulfobacterium sp. H_13]|uniref:hypothetical protein n=1 Tax=Candidatus Acidulodesulfobacterium sp. H_13 TaxID=3395470 RepID=UPI003AF90D78
MKQTRLKFLSLFVLGFLLTFLMAGNVFAETYGVFTQISVNVPGNVSSVVKKVKSVLNNKDWKVIGTFNTALPKNDTYISTVVVAANAAYNKHMVDNGNYPLGAFGLPLKVAVYTTPNHGIVVSMINLPAVARTFSGNSYVKYAVKASNGLRHAIRKAVGGTPSDLQYGPMRSGRFPGGIGGGSFPGSVVNISNHPESADVNLKSITKLVLKGIEHNKGKWQLIYKIEKPSMGFIELGVTRNSTERQSIGVDSGVRATSQYKYPGIDHSPAFPIIILIHKSGKHINVSILGEMWRMKYYFADAGWWAFMTHMGMPGSIQGSLKQMILSGLAH